MALWYTCTMLYQPPSHFIPASDVVITTRNVHAHIYCLVPASTCVGIYLRGVPGPVPSFAAHTQ